MTTRRLKGAQHKQRADVPVAEGDGWHATATDQQREILKALGLRRRPTETLGQAARRINVAYRQRREAEEKRA